jgi:hypothetical protein
MKKSISLTRQAVLTTFMLALLSVTFPAWSDFVEKPSIKGAARKGDSIKKDDKSKLDRKESENAVLDGNDKGGSTVKKKAVKKAGAAAAVGIVGNKVTSIIKK